MGKSETKCTFFDCCRTQAGGCQKLQNLTPDGGNGGIHNKIIKANSWEKLRNQKYEEKKYTK